MLGGVFTTGYEHSTRERANSLRPPTATSRKLSMMISTFNMGNAQCDEIDMLVPQLGDGIDLFVLGFQESTWGSVYPTKYSQPGPETRTEEALSARSAASVQSRSSHSMEACVGQLLGSIECVLGGGYELVAHNKNVQMQLMIFAKKSLAPVIRNISMSQENTGFLHLLPNKGGLCVDLMVDGTRLVFVTTHLAAHEGVSKCAARNDSIQEIMGGIRSKLDDDRFDPTLQAHHVFWMGDMNYRVTLKKECPQTSDKARALLNERMKDLKLVKSGGKVSAKLRVDEIEEDDEQAAATVGDATRQQELNHIANMIENEQWADILELDELNREIKANRVLQGTISGTLN